MTGAEGIFVDKKEKERVQDNIGDRKVGVLLNREVLISLEIVPSLPARDCTMPTALKLDRRKPITYESALKKDADIISQAASLRQ